MADNNEQVKKNIAKLVDKYERIKAEGKIGKYNEAQTRNEFIEPLFELLGWDMRNVYERNEVVVEETISKGRVDLAFRLNGIPKFFLEAKSLKSDLDIESYSRQAVNYSWNKGVSWAVLTDFESLKLYNAQAKSKSLQDKLVFEIPYNEYISDFDRLRLLSKESFLSNGLDKYAEKYGKKIRKQTVTEKLYEDLRKAREILTKSFGTWNKNLSQEDLDEGVQRILDRLIFIRVLEDKELEEPTLKPLINAWKKDGSIQLFENLTKKFRELDHIYNSNLFSDHFCEKWKEYGKGMEDVVAMLYGTDMSEYDFKHIPADILGGVYESYLGYISQNPIEIETDKKSGKLLKFEDKKELKLKSRKKRKEQGIYYTPKYIVDYIVKETLGKKLEEVKSIHELKQLKILDPACGSGSFLTKALETINDKYKDFSDPGNQATKTQILTENIHGVDLDPQAVELAKLNLLIDALDKKDKLPDLTENVRVGNSLISGKEEELKKYFGKKWRDKKPFNWDEEFSNEMKQGGFDVIIGNPPYVSFYSKQAQTSSNTEKELNYYKKAYDFIEDPEKLGRFNTVMFFLEKSLSLLREGGRCGFVIDMNIFGNPYRDIRKFLLKNSKINSIVVNLTGFKEVGSGQVIIIFTKSNKDNNKNEVVWSEDIEDKNVLRIKQGIWNNPDTDYQFAKIKDAKTEVLMKKIYKHGLLKNQYPGKLIRTSITFTGKKDKFLISQDDIEKHKNKIIFPLLEGSNSVSRRYIKPTFRNYVNYDEKLRDKLNAEYVKQAAKGKKRTPMVIGLGSLDAFKSPKIIVRLSSKDMTATYSEDILCADLSLYVIVKKDKDNKSNCSLKYTLAILNSKLVNFYARGNKLLKQEKGGMPQIRLRDLKMLPLYSINFSDKSEKEIYNNLDKMADKMLDLNKQIQSIPENSEKWKSIKREIEKADREIDEKVYELYGLTENEIKIVENSNKN